MKKVELDGPHLGWCEKYYFNKYMGLSFVSTFGPFISEFEDEFPKYVGIKRAVSVQSGAAAIHMAFHELGMGRDDEVIAPFLTFISYYESGIIGRSKTCNRRC